MSYGDNDWNNMYGKGALKENTVKVIDVFLKEMSWEKG